MNYFTCSRNGAEVTVGGKEALIFGGKTHQWISSLCRGEKLGSVRIRS